MGQILRIVRGALSRRHVVEVRLTHEVTATIYDKPGRWMPDAELESLRAELRGVAQAAIPGDLAYGVFLPERRPYENRLVVVGRHLARGEAVGFNAMPELDVALSSEPGGPPLPARVRVLHLGLLVIHPRYQRQGFQGLLYGLGAFSALHRIPERPVWISNVTEVPAVFGAVSDHFLDAYPSYKVKGPPPALHRAVALGIMRGHAHEFGVASDAAFDAERFVIQGSYTGGSDALKKTFEKAPKHRHEAANAYCQAALDYGRGDDFLQIAQLDGGVISNWLAERIPEDLRPLPRSARVPPLRAGAHPGGAPASVAMMPPAYYGLVLALLVLDAALSRWAPASPHARRSAVALAIAYPPIVLLPLLSPLAVTLVAAGAGMLGLVSYARMVGLAGHGRSFGLTVLCALSFFVAASVHWYGLFQAMPVFAMLFVAMAASVRAEPQAFLQRMCLSWLGLLVYGYLFAHAAVFTDTAVTPLGSLPPATHWIAVILLCAKLADVGWEAARKLGAKAEDWQIVVCSASGALGGALVHVTLPTALPAPRFAVLGLVVGLGIGAASRVYKLIVTDVLGEDPARPMKGTMVFGFAFALALGYHYIRYVA